MDRISLRDLAGLTDLTTEPFDLLALSRNVVRSHPSHHLKKKTSAPPVQSVSHNVVFPQYYYYLWGRMP